MTPRDQVRAWSSNLRAVAAALELERSKESRSHWICPRHNGGSLSLRLGEDGTLQARCFGCDLAGDVFNLASEVFGEEDFPKVLARLADLAGVSLEDPSRWIPVKQAPKRQSSPPMAPTYPPREEVLAVWGAALEVTRSRAARDHLSSRRIDPRTVCERDLARVLHPGCPVFPWMPPVSA